MSEVETNEIEQETQSPEVENQGIYDFLNSIQNKDFANAENQFNGLLDDRVQDVLDQTRIGLANNIFNGAEEESESEISDEETLAELETEVDVEENEEDIS